VTNTKLGQAAFFSVPGYVNVINKDRMTRTSLVGHLQVLRIPSGAVQLLTTLGLRCDASYIWNFLKIISQESAYSRAVICSSAASFCCYSTWLQKHAGRHQ